MSRSIATLPDALAEPSRFDAALGGRTPAVFLDYDGTLTPIVQRPELAVLSEAMRAIVRALAERCPVCVVSGRDRPDVARLVGLETLIYAGSHGFDIHTPDGRTIHKAEGAEFGPLLADVRARLERAVGPIAGAQLEPKQASIAVHYRNVAAAERPRVKAAVDALLADRPDHLKVTPGKMVWEVQPRIDWNKGRAVLYLLEVLGLEDAAHVPLFFGDDVTDEDAFRVLAGRGVGVFVGDAADPEVGERDTAAHFRVADPERAGALLDRLGR